MLNALDPMIERGNDMATTRMKLDPKALPVLSEAARQHYDRTPDSAIDYSETPDFGDMDWSALRPEKSTPKPAVTMRLDEAVITHFKAEDPKGYTARMASVLSAYVAAKQTDRDPEAG